MVVLDSDIEVRVVLAFVVAMLLLKFGAQAQHLCYRFSQRSNEVDRHDPGDQGHNGTEVV